MNKPGSLFVVGSGIKYLSDLTVEAKGCITSAEEVFFASVDPLTANMIHSLNKQARGLPAYIEGKPRAHTYQLWVDLIMNRLRKGKQVCLVAYGHPGVFARVPHQVIKTARSEGYKAFMFPGVSALAHLFADLGVDPAEQGLQCFEATDFLIYKRRFDPQQALILWQISIIGIRGYQETVNRAGLAILQETLLPCYGSNHDVIIYKASQLALCPPHLDALPLAQLKDAPIPQLATLYVPPLSQGKKKPDSDMLHKLGLDSGEVEL